MPVKPKRSLGQNFIFDKNIQNKIINACDFGSDDIVVEIGSGHGDITVAIAGQVKYIYAVEIDKSLTVILADKLAGANNCKILNQDILGFDFRACFQKHKKKVKVFGNIPYYITTPIIEFLLGNREYIDSIFLTVQKEFAQRAIAEGPSRECGRLSFFIQYYSLPKIIFIIKKTCFYPVPKVDSALLMLGIRQSPAVKVSDEEYFFKLIKTAFSQRRKTLVNTLKDLLPKERIEAFLSKRNLQKSIRPESLSLADFADLSNY